MMDSQPRSFNKLVIDTIKKNDLKVIFQILMIMPNNRTIQDLNTLINIVLNIQPIKQINNFSAIHHACKSMYLAKFKEKDFIYQKKQESESLYIILNGKVGLYKRSTEEYESEQVVFLQAGSCFGKIFNWKVRFLPLALQQTLIAILPKRQFNKIGVVVNIQKQLILKQMKGAGIITSAISEQAYRSVSNMFMINRIPHGHFLIKSGETPKVIFLLLKGMVKKIFQIEDENQTAQSFDVSKSQYYIMKMKAFQVLQYSAGDYFPKQNLFQPVNYSLVTECACQVITLPKKALKAMGYKFDQNEADIQKNTQYYKSELKKQEDWEGYKQNVVKDVLKGIELKKQQNKFR